MTVQLSPKLEALVKQDVERGLFRSAEEFVERAVTELHEREEWLAAHRDEIRTKIDEGWASAERGELISSDQVWKELEEKKAIWTNSQTR
jgi:putative addiction module CopG family antidote